MKNEEIVIAKIAKIAHDKGLLNLLPEWEYTMYKGTEDEAQYISTSESLIPLEADNIFKPTELTYHKLIDWIFSELHENILENNVQHLEFWYNLLKNCLLSYEFIGRLKEWFRNNNKFLHIILLISGYSTFNIKWFDDDKDKFIEIPGGIKTGDWNTTENEGILQIFTLLKKE